MRVEVDISQIEALAGRLNDVGVEGLGETVIRVVNNVIDEVYDTSRQRMNAGINLDDEYLRQRMTVAHATSHANAQATITVDGSPGRMTRLARYDPIQTMVPSKKGGTKRGGVSVEVTRGARKDMQWGFFKKLNSGNGLGLFTRDKDGRVRHRYGPSVYQLFNHYLSISQDEIRVNLETQLVDAINLQLTKVIE